MHRSETAEVKTRLSKAPCNVQRDRIPQLTQFQFNQSLNSIGHFGVTSYLQLYIFLDFTG